MPINAIISIVVKVTSDEDALKIVRLKERSILEGTSFGNRLIADNPIKDKIISEDETNAFPNLLSLISTGK